jgi:hypothetical protein
MADSRPGKTQPVGRPADMALPQHGLKQHKEVEVGS